MQKINLKTPGKYYSLDKNTAFGGQRKYYVFLPDDNSKPIEFHYEDHSVEIGYSRVLHNWVEIENPFTTRGKYYGDANRNPFTLRGESYYLYAPDDGTKLVEIHNLDGSVEMCGTRTIPIGAKEVLNPFISNGVVFHNIKYDEVLAHAYKNNLYFTSLFGMKVRFYLIKTNEYVLFADGDRNRYISVCSNKELVEELIRYNAKVIRNTENIQIVDNKFVHVNGCINPPTISTKSISSPAPVASYKKYVANGSKRDNKGRFRAKSNVAEFYYANDNNLPTFRRIKIDTETDTHINGIDLEKGEYRSFLKNKICNNKIYRLKLYV